MLVPPFQRNTPTVPLPLTGVRRARVARLMLSCMLALTAAGTLPTATAHAQGKSAAPEFTRQLLLIANFAPGGEAKPRMGRRAAESLRSRLGRLLDKRSADMVSSSLLEEMMSSAGMNPDTAFTPLQTRAIGKFFRADELISGTVHADASGIRLSGALILSRDDRLRQPLPTVRAPTLDSAATLFAQAIVAARTQLSAQRRCENFLREANEFRAETAAREGIATYPNSTIARTCLVWSLRQQGAPAAKVVAAAREVLAIDSMSFHAVESTAIALDSLKRRDEAATMWLRLAVTDTTDLELALRVGRALLDGQNARSAEPFVRKLATWNRDDLRVTQLVWRAAYDMRDWSVAIEAGETLMKDDVGMREDSTFHLRLGTAYRAANRRYKTIETLAHAVAMFPKDARLYSLYTLTIKAESDSVLPRGLALFPQSADLLSMNARELRVAGKLAESLETTRRAIAIDSTLPNGQLVAAQLELELGRPDSALSSLRRAVTGGGDSTGVAQFALSKGNAFYRAASTTQTSADFGLALRFLTFADTVHTSTQARFLSGAAALGVARAALAEATKTTDKIERCRLARLGTEMLPLARTGLEAGQETYVDMAKQSLDYLTQLVPYVGEQERSYCSGP